MKLREKLIKLIFIFSLPFFSLLVCGDYELSYMKYVILLSFLCGIFIIFKVFKGELFKRINYKYLVFSILFGLYSGNLFSRYSSAGINYVFNIFNDILKIVVSFNNIKSLVSFLAIPSLIILIYYLVLKIFPFVKKEVASLTKLEKKFIFIMFFIGVIATIVIYTATNAFYHPVYNDRLIYFDTIYTADSGSLFHSNAYLNFGMEENDIRQPLFGVFSAPFAIVSYFVAEFLFFIPNSQIVIFNSLQILLMAVAIVMISRLLKLEGKKQLIFQLLLASCFPVILYSFLLEQYVIAFFYLILALYLGDKKEIEVNYSYVGAVGTLLTSGIVFPVISRFKNVKHWVVNVLKCFIFFIIVMILSGQFLQLVSFVDKFDSLMRFSGKELLFVEKFRQFLYFVKSVFIAPKGGIEFIEGVPCYRMIYVDFISRFGIVTLITCVVSVFLNRRNRMVVVSFLWVIFSFLILCVLGWGTMENGLILYSLYFSWAYGTLVYLFVDKIIKNKKIQFLLLGILCLVILSINVCELWNIVSFGIKYY